MSVNRKYPSQPLVGVGAVILDDGRVLLIKRRHEPGFGKWSIPGGLVELGESVREACKREVLEEVGYKVRLLRILDVIDNIVRDESGSIRFHYIIVDFLAKPIAQVNPNPEHKEMMWFTSEEVQKLDLTKTAKKLLKKIKFLNDEI